MRPSPDDYGAYYQTYLDLVEGDDFLSQLATQGERTQKILRGVAEAKGNHRYATGKWSVKELLGHLLDSEWIFTVRALCIARGEAKPLPGFEQDDYVREGRFDDVDLARLARQMRDLRAATIDFFQALDPAVLDRRGEANGHPLTPRAVGFILVGHERHHLSVLLDRYL